MANVGTHAPRHVRAGVTGFSDCRGYADATPLEGDVDRPTVDRSVSRRPAMGTYPGSERAREG